MHVFLLILALFAPLCAQAADTPLSPDARILLLEQELFCLCGGAAQQAKDEAGRVETRRIG